MENNSLGDFVTIEEAEKLWRTMSVTEKERAKALLPVISNSLRQEADKAGKDLDEMIKASTVTADVVKSVTVDVLARTLMTSTDQEPMTQESQSALGYTVSGSFLVPGGGLFIKKSELARIGLKKQRIGGINLYGDY